MRRLPSMQFVDAHALHAWLLLSLGRLAACSIEDTRGDRCGAHGVCPEGFECYRSFCVPLEQLAEPPVTGDSGSLHDPELPDGEVSTPHGDGPARDPVTPHDGGLTSALDLDAAQATPAEPDAAPDSKGVSELDASPPPTKLLPVADAAAPKPAPLDASNPVDAAAGQADTGVPPVPPEPEAGVPSRALGEPCGDARDCTSGVCLVPKRAGYCSAYCRDEGSTMQCPDGSVCKRSKGRLYCLPTCITSSTCPPESSCKGVPWSFLSACEPRG